MFSRIYFITLEKYFNWQNSRRKPSFSRIPTFLPRATQTSLKPGKIPASWQHCMSTKLLQRCTTVQLHTLRFAGRSHNTRVIWVCSVRAELCPGYEGVTYGSHTQFFLKTDARYCNPFGSIFPR